MLSRSLLSFSCVLALAACTATADDGASGSEDDLHSKPNGPDASPGSVIVKSPGGAPKLAKSTYRVNYSNTETPLDTAVSNLKIGPTRIDGTSGTSSAVVAFISGQVTIENGKRFEVDTAALHLSRKANVFGLSVLATGGGGSSRSGDLATAISWSEGIDTTPEAVAVLPGDYNLWWGWGDGYVATTSADALTDIQLGADYTQRRVARLVAPASRDYPEACSDKTNQYRIAYRSPGKAQTDNRSVKLDPGTGIEIGRNPKLAPDDVILSVALPCVGNAATIPYGDLGAGPRDFTIGRLDVDDVSVTEDDGSTRTAKGTWTVLDPGTKTSVLSSSDPFPTSTGIDLPPGSYLLHVEYAKSDGTTGVYEQNVTF